MQHLGVFFFAIWVLQIKTIGFNTKAVWFWMICGYPHFMKPPCIPIFLASYVYRWEYTHRHGFYTCQDVVSVLTKFLYSGPFALQELSQGCLECFQPGGEFVDVQCRNSEMPCSWLLPLSMMLKVEQQQKLAACIMYQPECLRRALVEPRGAIWNLNRGPGLVVQTLLIFSAHLIYLHYPSSGYKW